MTNGQTARMLGRSSLLVGTGTSRINSREDGDIWGIILPPASETQQGWIMSDESALPKRPVWEYYSDANRLCDAHDLYM